MNILVDTLSMTWKYDAVSLLYELLDIPATGTQPLKTKWYHNGEYFDGILIAYNLDEYNQVTETFLDISGKGCRTVETLNPGFNWFDFLHRFDSQIRDKTAHIARIDISCDVLDGSVSFGTVWRFAYNDLFVCRSKCLPEMTCRRKEVVYFGSPKSDRILRIYNKALEQGIPDTDWLRFEMQMRNDNAISFYLNWCSFPDQIGTLFRGVLLDFIRFVEPPKGKKLPEIKQNRNQGRLPTAKWYAALIGDVDRISQLYLPGEEYTLGHLERYLEKQSYSSLKTYLEAHDGDLTSLLVGIKHSKLNARQRLLLAQLHIEKDKPIQTEYTNSELE